MRRLNDRAFAILQAELRQQKAAGGSTPQWEVVLQRLERFRVQEGTPLTEAEIQAAVVDMFPNFSQDAIRQAARANQPSAMPSVSLFKWGAIALVGAVGGLYVLNLPFPPIRYPVSRVAPILLLPSFVSMDRHYRQAVSLVEQADQLVNQATSPEDLELGAEKVALAQKSLDKLPVWFLGYYPQAYCGWFGCSWRFTLDEFQGARASVGRMEAKLFQERNAFTKLAEAETAIATAKQQYQQAAEPQQQQTAIAQWQMGIDTLVQLPSETVAGQVASTKLEAYQRDFQQVAGMTAGTQQSGTLLEAAKQFAMQAAVLSQNPPHDAATWQEVVKLWEEAIARLEEIASDNPGYLEAQTKLAQYKTNLAQVQIRLQAELDSVEALAMAQQQIEQFIASIPQDGSPTDRNFLLSELQSIINQLSKVKPGTTASQEAQQLQQFAQGKLQELQ